MSTAVACSLPPDLQHLLMLQARTELQKEVLDILSAGQPASADPNLRASSKLLQPSTPAASAPGSPANGKTLLLQHSSSLDGTLHSYKDDQSAAVIVPVLPDSPDHDTHPASSGSMTRAWLADMAHRAHDQERGCKALVAHFQQAARVRPTSHPVLFNSSYVLGSRHVTSCTCICKICRCRQRGNGSLPALAAPIGQCSTVAQQCVHAVAGLSLAPHLP